MDKRFIAIIIMVLYIAVIFSTAFITGCGEGCEECENCSECEECEECELCEKEKEKGEVTRENVTAA